MNLFVYGTLRSERLAEAVAGRKVEAVRATLPGYEVWSVADAITPLIRPSEGAVAEGQLWRDVTIDLRDRLDLYEGAFGYTLAPVEVSLNGTPDLTAWVYMPPADLTPGEGAWDFDAWRPHEDFSVLAAQEVFHHDPPLTKETLTARWPQIQKRAWSKAHARNAERPPAALRYDPAPADFTIPHRDPVRGTFFGLQSFRVDHHRFDGTRTETMHREVFLGMEAVMVLPYDPSRDKLLLVEQARMGPAMRDDANPWTLEPVAGMIDALEAPETTAHRETEEETGLTLDRLEHIASFYPSPGSSTDYFHAYLGLCDLPNGESWTGGLDTEHEDLRLHVIPFARAMDLIGSGEINVGPLMMMLHWLAGQRERLRATA